MKNKYEHLGQLFGGYFHQDWDLEGEDYRAVMAVYLREITSKQLRKTIDEANSLLETSTLIDGEPESTLEKLGCEYYYQADNLTGTEWLEIIRDLLVLNIKV